jgi:hypothetical protein
LENGATRSQDILAKEDPEALKQFKTVVEDHKKIAFSKEKIKNRTAFADIKEYLEKSELKKEDIEALTLALEKSKNGGAVEITVLASFLKSDSAAIKKIAQMALTGFEHQITSAKAEIGELSKGSIKDVLCKLSTQYGPSDFADKLNAIIKDPKNTEKEFTFDLPLAQLIRTPKSSKRLIQTIESYIAQPGVNPQDAVLLQNVLDFIKADLRVKTTETIKSSKVVQ